MIFSGGCSLCLRPALRYVAPFPIMLAVTGRIMLSSVVTGKAISSTLAASPVLVSQRAGSALAAVSGSSLVPLHRAAR